MDDLIKRADAIERIANDNVVGGMKRINEYRDSTERNDYLDGISTAIATVYDLPSAEAVKVAYICDGRKCDSDCSECFRTLDIEHARDFTLMGDTYFQQEAEAGPKVIRSKTLLPTKDFKEWAKRVRETNPNAVVIPCDAEVVSAEAVQRWIPCSERLPNESGDYLCTIPLDADETYTEVLTFYKGRFYEDDDEWGATYHDDVLAWMPLPKPYKGGE